MGISFVRGGMIGESAYMSANSEISFRERSVRARAPAIHPEAFKFYFSLVTRELDNGYSRMKILGVT